MTSNDESWMIDAVDDLIHSSIWLTPVQTFIDEHCVYFEIDESEESSTLPEEQTQIHENYFDLIRSLIDGLALDLGVDKTRPRDCSLKKETIIIDEFYEQLHSAKNVELFREMMRKRNLILQLQALAHIQIKTDDDEILRLVVRATRSTNQNENRFDDRAKTKVEENSSRFFCSTLVLFFFSRWKVRPRSTRFPSLFCDRNSTNSTLTKILERQFRRDTISSKNKEISWLKSKRKNGLTGSKKKRKLVDRVQRFRQRAERWARPRLPARRFPKTKWTRGNSSPRSFVEKFSKNLKRTVFNWDRWFFISSFKINKFPLCRTRQTWNICLIDRSESFFLLHRRVYFLSASSFHAEPDSLLCSRLDSGRRP